jgi:hypothetical protein
LTTYNASIATQLQGPKYFGSKGLMNTTQTLGTSLNSHTANVTMQIVPFKKQNEVLPNLEKIESVDIKT